MKVLLVVAHDRGVCEALRASMREEDLLLFEQSVEDAGRRLVSLQADGILVDDAPQLGVDALVALRGIAPDTPIAVLTARNDTLSEANFIRNGAAGFLTKPFSQEELTECLRGLGAHRATVAREMVGMAVNLPRVVPDAVSITWPGERRAVNVHADASMSQQQMALRWLSRASSSRQSPERRARSFAESALDIFGAVRVAVLLESEGSVRIAASEGIADNVVYSLQLGYGFGLMRCFDESASLVDRVRASATEGALKHFQVLGAHLAAPLLRDGRVFGAVVLGEKADGRAYSHDERELLTLMARSTSACFERADEEHTLAEDQHFLTACMQEMPTAVVSVAPDKTVNLMNRKAEQLLGLSAADAVGRSVQKLGSSLADIALRTMRDGEPADAQEVYEPGAGMALRVQANRNGQGGVMLTFTSVIEPEVDAAGIAGSPFWEYLSSRVAQEVKNPMVAINTFAQLLPRKYASEDFRDTFSRVVQEEVQRINSVVETLFEFARNPSVHLQTTNVIDPIKQVLAQFDEELRARAITVDFADESEIPVSVDPKFFKQALENVVKNSIEAMPDGGRLHVGTRLKGDHAEVVVADTGSGVAAKDESQIFLPFYSTKERGMGLGLSIADRIMKQHHGKLRLVQPKDLDDKLDPAFHSTFILDLPVQAPRSSQEA